MRHPHLEEPQPSARPTPRAEPERQKSPQHADELRWLRSVAEELATRSVTRMERTLPWFAQMPASRRAAISQLAHTGIQAFVNYYDNSGAPSSQVTDIFGSAPRELLRSISLQETLQLTEVVVSVVEERVATRSDALRLATLQFSRDVAFAAADLYARAAEARGLWDARLEALVVDSIVTGESPEDLSSRIAALGWSGSGHCAVLLGAASSAVDVDVIRRHVRKQDIDVLVAVQGKRLVLVLGLTAEGAERHPDPDEVFRRVSGELESHFGPAPVVLGPTVPQIIEAYISARACIAATAVAPAYRQAPRPVHADQLLPERAFAGDPIARRTLIDKIYTPLKNAGGDLMNTLLAYLESGRSLEATSRDLYVHTNTVRYRMKKVQDLVRWNPTVPREAFVLQAALAVGAIQLSSTRVGNPGKRNVFLHRYRGE